MNEREEEYSLSLSFYILLASLQVSSFPNCKKEMPFT